MRWAVILAGGSGSRFWPLSTPSRPKQVLPLSGDRSTAEEAFARLDGLVPRERILLVTGAALAAPLQDLLGIAPENLESLVPERDVNALASKIAELCDAPERWPAMGRAGRAFVEQRYNIRALNERLVDIYREVITEFTA